jgi:two-component system, NarL family, nitrate/nitrite response regulator NarL
MPEARLLKIMLVDDHALFRESVARLLAAEPAFLIVAHCSTTQEGYAVLKKNPVDVVLLDFDLGDRDCTEFLHLATDADFQGKILLVTAGLPEAQAINLIQRGVAGIFMKHDSPALLAQAIHAVVSGETWFSQQFRPGTTASAAFAPAEHESARTAAPKPSQPAPLTERERQVLIYVFEGLANKEIADRLVVSESSVKATLQQLFSKTGVRTRGQLVRVALEQYKDLL